MKKKTFYGTSGPYLTVYRLLKFLNISICIHKFHTPDEDPDCHDHPFHFFTMVLRGGYVEHLYDGRKIKRGPLSCGVRFTTTLHRVDKIIDPCWTLCVKVSPKEPREWGFMSNGVWVHWREYIARKGLKPVDNSEDAY